MQYQSMPADDSLTILGDLRRAKKCTDDNVRFVLQGRKLTGLPKGIENIGHIPRVELDLSYNRTLAHDTVFQSLAEFKNLKGLGLIKHEMGTLPSSVGLMENLEVLELWSNGLKELPSSFSNLKNLTYLNLRNNKLTEIPSYFSQFKKLKTLILRFNKIKTIPDFIFDLTELEHLDVGTCGLKEIPTGIGKLKKLKTLTISKNDIQRLPEELKECKNLELIEFNGNKKLDLEQTFEVMSFLPNISELNLQKYGLKYLPESIGKLKSVKKVNLIENALEGLPSSFAELDLKEFSLRNNPWKMEKVLPVLGRMPIFKSFDAYYFEELGDPNFIVPESFGDCQYLESIQWGGSNVNLPNSVGRLKKLKRISIFGSGISSLPPSVADIPNLESLTISRNPNLTEFPEFIYKMDRLSTFSFSGNGCEPDYDKMVGMKGLTRIFFNSLSKEKIDGLKNFKNLKCVEIFDKDSKGTLPDSFFELSTLETVSLRRINISDKARFIKGMLRFQNLKDLKLGLIRLDEHFDTFIQACSQLKNLKKLTINFEQPLKDEHFQHLSHLEELQILPGARFKFQLENLPAFASFPEGILKISNYQNKINELDEIKAELKNKYGADHPRYTLFYSILLKNFSSLENYLENPFDENGKLEDSLIYISAKPRSGTLTELRKKLKERGAKISKELDEKVTHVFLSSTVKDEYLNSLLGDYQYILEDHLIAKELDENTPYLMEESSDEMIGQITNLLKAHEEDRTALVLELIEGGGATKKIISYLGAIHLFHKDVAIRRKSRNLFRKYASSALQEHVKKHWKNSYQDKNIDRFKNVLVHEEWDVGAFLLAWRMIVYHLSSENSTPKSDWLKRQMASLNISRLSADILSPSFKDFEDIKHLTLSLDGELNWDFLAEVVQINSMETLTARQAMNKTPNLILEQTCLKNFTGGVWSQFSVFDFSAIKNDNPALTSLNLVNCEIKNIQDIIRFPNLEELVLHHCQIDEISSITQLIGLKKLNLNLTKVDEIDSTFEKLENLESINIQDCGLMRANLNFSAFKQLKQLNLSKNNLMVLPDTFGLCSNLKQVWFDRNQLKSLPTSLFKIAYGLGRERIQLSAKQNDISYIGEAEANEKKGTLLNKIFKKKTLPMEHELANFSTIDLENNKLEEIPPIILNLGMAGHVKLYGNPIKNIPDSESWNGNIVSLNIHSPELEEVPSYLFGRITKFVFRIENTTTKFPTIDEIPEYTNITFSNYGLAASYSKRFEALKKKNKSRY